MIRINNFLHRQKFSALTRRWFHNQWEPSDLPLLKELINYNSLWLGRINKHITQWMFSELTGQTVHAQQVNTKGELKDLLVQSPPYVNDRILQLIDRYQRNPERYFRETPFLGTLFSVQRNGQRAYIGSSRIKRVRRIAEKGARRITEYISARLQDQTQLNQAPKGWNQPWSVSASNDYDEYERAERNLSAALRRGRLFDPHLEFVLDDVLGLKVIVEPQNEQQVIRLLENNPRCELVEVEQHRGHYNATNVVFRFSPNVEELLATAFSAKVLEGLKFRGIDPATAEDNFRSFVCTGESSIHIELIMTRYQEMLESEIGRSMHEQRLMRQRTKQPYRGHLARNVSYLMEYIFAWGISPRTTISTLPIQIWNQYLPDYFDEAVKDLFQIPRFRQLE